MAVRFRQTAHRRQVSLVETRRAEGRMRHEHIAGLGSILLPQTVVGRSEFWERLHQSLARLSNRLGVADQGKILAGIYTRIPMPTLDERRALQLENAEEDERFWSGLQQAQKEHSAENQELAAAAGREAYRATQEAEKAAAHARTARERIARLKAGEDIGGGTSSTRLSQKEMIAIIGGPAAARRAARVSEIYEAGASEELLEETSKEHRSPLVAGTAHVAYLHDLNGCLLSSRPTPWQAA